MRAPDHKDFVVIIHSFDLSGNLEKEMRVKGHRHRNSRQDDH